MATGKSTGAARTRARSNQVRTHPKAPSRKTSWKPHVPQTLLVSVSDALATICATVDVTVSALAKDENDALATNAGQVLLAHVYEPLSKQRAIIEAHKCRPAEPLVRSKCRKRRAPDGSRKGERRRRDRQKALKP